MRRRCTCYRSSGRATCGAGPPTFRVHASVSIPTVASKPNITCFRRSDCYADGAPELLFCENETNHRRLSGLDIAGCFKDGINDYIVHGAGMPSATQAEGSKCAFHYRLVLAAGATAMRPTSPAPCRRASSALYPLRSHFRRAAGGSRRILCRAPAGYCRS